MGDPPKGTTSPEQLFLQDLQSLRIGALHRAATAGIVVGILWYLYTTVILESTDLALWVGPIALTAGSVLARIGEPRWRYGTAAIAFISSLAICVILAARGYAEPTLLVLLAVPVGVAGLLATPSAGFLAAAGATAIVAILPRSATSLHVASSLARLVAALSFTVAALVWQATYALRTTVYWAWKNYGQAREQADELREQRAQLSRRLKDLDAAYDRMETMAAELEHARQAAIEARRLKAEFAANISHELRTPLNLVIGFSEMMAMAPQVYGAPLPPAYRGDVQAIYYNAQHLSHLIDDVLDLGQIEASRMGLIREPVSLARLIEEAVAAVGHLIESRGLSLSVNIPASPPVVEADPTRIRQVLINLLNNASRFTDQGGVTISAEADERDVTVSVADTGTGIAEEDIPHVFEEFRQLDGSIRRRVGGSGLGLSISRKFVQLHGGRMWIESKLGQGTTVRFSLPMRERWGLAQLPAEYETWARLGPVKGTQRAIVVVDEDPAVGEFLQRYLEGYEVVRAGSAEEARSLIEQRPAGAALVVVPPGRAGADELCALRARFQNVPVFVCSMRTWRSAGQLPGVVSYLVKPITQQRFLAALADLGVRVRSLLIADDDPEIVRLLSHMARLAPRPYRVFTAYDGTRALQILRSHRLGAVVLDLRMPEVDGYAVLEQMRADERLRSTPVIVATATGREEVMRADLLGITRSDGLSLDELVRCLKLSLDTLYQSAPAGNAPTPPATPVARPA